MVPWSYVYDANSTTSKFIDYRLRKVQQLRTTEKFRECNLFAAIKVIKTSFQLIYSRRIQINIQIDVEFTIQNCRKKSFDVNSREILLSSEVSLA